MANKAEKLIGAGIIAATVGATGFSVYQTGRNDGLSQNIPANTAEGQMPSPSMTLSNGETVTITPSPSLENKISAAGFGKDAWSQDLSNWSPIFNNGVQTGEVLTPEPTGKNSVVTTLDGVGQAYWDARVSGDHQAIGLVIAKNLTLPVRGISVYPNNGEDAGAHLERAFQGQVKLERDTQPNVCTLEVTNSIQAVAGNEQSVSQDMWQAEKLTPQQAAAKFGRDAWSQNPDNWTSVDDGFGMKLAVNPNGLNSTVLMDGAVGQAYWDANVAGEHQAIAGTLGVGVEAPVRGVTVYAGVPNGMEDGALGNAFAKAVNLEIKTQPEVYVVKVQKSVCPTGEKTPSTDTQPSAQPTEQPTAAPTTVPTEKPSQAPTGNDLSWENNIKAEVPSDRLAQLPDGGLKIKDGSVLSISINANEKAVYWNGTKTVTVTGPATFKAGVASIYKIK